jgi:NADP-dependent 3-hydroxy acid dehydrogenase YdfG
VTDHGRIDVLVNNAGVMPLAFLADHARAADAWDRCIDINLKGVLHGIYAAYDHMVSQGGGHIVNIASIYGNYGVAGAAVYSATKAAVITLSNALRVEAQGKIKVTVVRPTGVPGTGLGAGIIDLAAVVPLAGHNADRLTARFGGDMAPEAHDPDDVRYWAISPEELASQIVYAIDQPAGVAISDITVRATGEDYVY